jgi:hypothetical protein
MAYTATFPESWYTNTAIGDVTPCGWFAPTFYEVADPAQVPKEIGITLELDAGTAAYLDEFIINEETTVAGLRAFRVEVKGGDGDGSGHPAEWREYQYEVELLPRNDQGGPSLIATTANDMGGEYELNKAVLDRIMATLELDR